MLSNPEILFILFCVVLFLVLTFSGIFIFRRRRAARRLETPESFVLLREPGETLRREVEALGDRIMDTLLLGTWLVLMAGLLPMMLLKIYAAANPLPLMVSSLALFIAVAVVVVRRVVKLLDERANRHLGYLGERRVAEYLHELAMKGWRIFHDVPVTIDGYPQNIDHLAIGPHGAAVIETKTRSKPLKEGTEKIEVKFDGERLHWPTYQHDWKPIAQVARCAKWVEETARAECGLDVPVTQVIAIPGWSVKELVLTTPRVVSGAGVAAAVTGFKEPEDRILTEGQIEELANAIDKLCRDVKE